ncbi:MAG: M24 family metallopeptidase [Nitrospirae bacterium]|nr:M24 family metallopeptidase [Nitrospirota bacterium]
METDQKPDYSLRVRLVRNKMTEKNLSGLIVRGTDRFLNEYVPESESTRVWVSGFSGSAGDLFITLRDAFLFVDGRYHLQAEHQVDPKIFKIEKVPLGTSLEKALIQKIKDLFPATPARIGFEPDRFSIETFDRLKKSAEKLKIETVPLTPSLVEEVRGPIKEKTGKIWKISPSLTGFPAAQKLARLREFMSFNGIDLWFVQTLDEIAYLTNLRGNEIPYQATFKSLVLVTSDRCYVALPEPERAENPELKELTLIDIDDWKNILKNSEKNRTVGYDPSTTTEAIRMILVSHSFKTIPLPSPIATMKANKTPEELTHMIKAFAKADQVVNKAKHWLCRKTSSGEKISETRFAEKVAKLFKQSGAFSLSFHIISAAGKNGAVIHYSNPDPDRMISNGELMLLDTGAYYEGGYATDLTRTFLVGDSKTKGTEEQKKIFTTVLKGAIAGMDAGFPKGTSGAALDAIVRAPLWKAGYNYNHGTGHGVGINVHESPPRISSQGDSILEKGHVFSIEPGIYLSEFGGVRIENLCTVIDHPKYPDWLTVTPLTFSPLDERLIDHSLLSREEKKWLRWYKNQSKISHISPPLPFLA